MRSCAVWALPLLLPSLMAQASPDADRARLLRWNEAARTHVRATHIVRGVLRVDEESLQAAIADGGHVRVSVEVREAMHGAERASLSFRVYVPETGVATRPWHWATETVRAWQGQDRIAFVVNGWLASDDATQAVLESSKANLVAVRRREMLHRELLRQPLQLDRGRSKRVRRLVRRICAGRDEQRDAFQEIEQLGASHLAELVTCMDDRRRLPEGHITLANKAKDRFEATRTYGVVEVVDALDALLNQITGENFHLLCDCDDDARRRAVVRAWRLYARYLEAGRGLKKRGRK